MKAENILKLFFSSAGTTLAFCIAFSFLLHFPFFDMPPRGVHVWRQCNTMAVAKNFYSEDMNIFRPRVDRRLDTDGVTGMQFPSFEFLTALGYKIFGFHEYIPRVLNFFIFCFGIAAVYGLFLMLTNSKPAACLAAWSFTWSPELFYHSINALPDVLALSASVGGFYFFMVWLKEKSNPPLLFAIFLFLLAGLTKIQYLVIGFPVSFLFLKEIKDKNISTTQIYLALTLAVSMVGLVLSWYMYSLEMIEKSGLRDYGIGFNPITDLNELLEILKNNIISDLPEMLLGYPAFILFLIGIYVFFSGKLWNHYLFYPLLLWAVVLIAYHFIESGQMKHHGYYMMPYIPFLLFPLGLGAAWLHRRKLYFFLLLITIAQPVAASLRIIPVRWVNKNPGIPMELYDKSNREYLSGLVPNEVLSIVGPDNSGCIFFYFLDKKGFGFENSSELLSTMPGGNEIVIENYIRRGAGFIYSNDKGLFQNQSIKPFIADTIGMMGDFMVCKLKLPRGENAQIE